MSIVSVYCKSLLRLFIVGVYCKYLLCFIMFSVHNVARSLVLLRFRLQMLLFECVLLCFCSHMCRKHYKTNQKSCFLHINSPNPLFYRCNFFHYEKQYTFSKNSNETRRIWGTLAAPDFANSGKKHVHFPYVHSKVY